MNHEHCQRSGTGAPIVEERRSFWRTPGGFVTLLCLFAVAAYLFTEHRAHVFGVLPYLILLACPLMHLFMHSGHGDHPTSERKSQ